MNAQIRAEAADWVVEFQTGETDAHARKRFARWLRSSPEHVRAYIELVTFWEDAGRYDRGHAIDVDALIAAAFAEPEVVPLPGAGNGGLGPHGAGHQSAAPRARLRTRLSVAAAAVVVLMAMAALVLIFRPVEYATGIGERRTVTLADGTSVELDAVSRIRVQFGARERRIILLEGQAFFRVEKNPARPFVVLSKGTRIRDVGTHFDVNQTASSTIVTVVEGEVSVSCPHPPVGAPSPALVLMKPVDATAGEQVIVASHAIPRLEPANLAEATAWTRNELIFESTPLPQVALEFNRLNARQLVVEGRRLRNFRVSGVFPALDPTSLPRFLKFLHAQPGIEVIESGDRFVVREKK